MGPKSFFLAAGAAALCILGAAWLWLSRPAAPPASSASSASSGPASSAPGADSESPAPSEPAVTVIQDTFGFAGPDGSTLLLPAQAVQPQDPQAIDTAVGAWGTLLPVTWAGTQDADSQDTGRWTAANFGHMAGQLYQVEGAAALPDQTYYLIDTDGLDRSAFLPVEKGDHSPASGDLTARLEAETGRAVQDSWLLGTAGGEMPVYLVLFAPEGEDLLACIAADTPEGLLRRDYPAVLNGSSAWRVDDSGTMDPDLFQILFAARPDGQLLLGLTWQGAEGQSALLLQQEGQALQEREAIFYRYTSPA